MAMHSPAHWLHNPGRRGRPHHPPVPGWGTLRPGQLSSQLRTMQPKARRFIARTTTATKTFLDLVAAMTPCLLFVAFLCYTIWAAMWT